jgi:hypothetical protein
MNGRRLMITFLTTVLAFGAGYWLRAKLWPIFSTLNLDSEGGFAYVHTPADNKLEIAYLKDTHTENCDVIQMGVTLEVTAGTVTDPPGTVPGTKFHIEGAVVTFDSLMATPLNVVRGPRPVPPNTHPEHPGHDDEWKDGKWVVGVRQDYPDSQGNPAELVAQWRETLTDGRIVLTSGTFEAAHPSDPIATAGVWEFKSDDGGPTPFTQAITDRTHYSAKVLGTELTISLSGARSAPAKIVVEADSTRNIGLRLTGVHEDAPATIPIGYPIHHFCAFYSFFKNPVASNKQLIPHYAGIPSSSSGAGSPSPGGLCPGKFY